MPIKINHLKKITQKSSTNLVMFSDDKFNNGSLKKYLSSSELSYIGDLLKISDLKKNLLIFDVSSKKKIILISIKNNSKLSDIEKLGAEFYSKVNYGKNSEYLIYSDSLVGNNNKFLGHFLHGLKLKSYEFKKYKAKKDSRLISINVYGKKNTVSNKDQIKFKA